MQIYDHDPIELENLGGLFGRGEYKDNVPPDHLIDSLNTISIDRDFKTRDGFVTAITLPNIRRIWEYKRQGEASRVLILDNTGKIFDSAISLVTPILNIALMTDFSAISQYNRAYITPHNGSTGLAGEVVYVYSGAGTARAIAGVAPISGFSAATSVGAGNIESGTHIFAVCYEYDSGYITPPGRLTSIEADGEHKIDLSSIPIGPTGVIARRIVASRAIQQFNGDLEGYEMFFISDGRIVDNVTTILTVNFYDAELTISCDYLFDQLTSVPAVVNIISYNNRLVFISPNTDQSIAYVSKPSEPESINAAAGFITADPTETEGLKNGVEYRGSLYLTKASRLYAYTDNGFDASTWPPLTIDKGIGANVFSISVIQDNKGANQDFFLLGDESGLYIYNGTVVRPELSYKIINWWNRINKAVFNKVQIFLDTKKFLIYILVPLDSATSPSHIIVGDYNTGLDFKNIKWHIWNSTEFDPEALTVSVNSSTKKTFLRVAGHAGNIYHQTVGQLNDNSSAIDSYIQTALLFEEAGWVHHFIGIELRVIGAGALQLSLRGEDMTSVVNLNALTLASAPGREYFRTCNYNNEKCSVKLRVSSSAEWFSLRHFKFYTKPVWATRPG